ncbi:MAG: hypothetical protein COW00_08835 [Bdellovibrio sp. CG12_big_fil_rev_8_21_14_0_65_39_13]|nr:MAG: hypothetical protein COW78_08905 [Bdellovibrio sp. CG22_combo_CG10-13_8_21_14_all_39_27]PIQ59729.1 MAG: hypothetical protein COW00_08835 [Bdellovibrio sp. CG12_big_fil_rev_8_21_14_0_65_39_13]PIR36241.1 MAG: hypothetical protein COV37_04550 [Bdellovibrio sp. CG11_big_fil_rev_8_21_14_0_20_39_38]PJB54634.1 MAG: hypothetical protein CO099_00450 [Bdellovibrio sp. CG_4_9_14_3_um_filter_39_7]
MRTLLSTSLLLICLNLYAQDETDSSPSRSSSVSYTLDVGKDDYKNHSFSGSWGIDSQWAVGLNLSSSNDNTNSKYTAGSFYISSYWNDIFSNKFSLRLNKETPEEIVGAGADLETRAQYPLFTEDLYSSLSLSFGRMNYQQTVRTNNALGSVRNEVNFNQSFVKVSIEQDLTDWLTVGLSSTKYSYEDASQVTFTGKNNRFSASTSLDSTSDYPDQKNSLWVLGNWEKIEIEVSGSVTKSKLVDNNSKTKSLFVTWIIDDHWSTTVGIDSVTYDSTSSKSDTGSLGFAYSF